VLKNERMIRACCRLLPLSLLLAATPVLAESYFLHGAQAADLISRGQMTGEDGARYDVWVVPGYVGPGQGVMDGWSKAGHDLGEYADLKLYRDAYDTAGDALRFGSKDAIGKFAFKGSYTAWGSALSRAQERVDRRVFGWWFAYSWATIEATGESALRLALGVPGGLLIGGAGSTLVPVAQLAWPAVKSVSHSVGEGTALPLVAASWNTVIAPPMVVLGQQPTPQRADGFWLKRIDPAKTDAELAEVKTALQDWRQALTSSPENQVFEQQAKALGAAYAEKRKQLEAEHALEQQQLRDQQHQSLLQTAQVLMPGLDKAKLSAVVQRYGREPALAALSGGGVSRQNAEALLDSLVGPGVSAAINPPPERRADNDKTDPLKRSAELMRSL